MELSTIFFITIATAMITVVIPPVLASDTKKVKDVQCQKDKSVSINTEGNYQDCSSSRNLEQGLVQCCRVNNQWGCCPESQKQSNRMLKIGLGIAGVTLALGIVLWLALYCNSTHLPFMHKYEERSRACWEHTERHIICCRNKVKRREIERKIAENKLSATQHKYAVQEEEGAARSGGGVACQNEIALRIPSRVKRQEHRNATGRAAADLEMCDMQP